MGILNFFQKRNNFTTENSVLGPTFLKNNVEHIMNSEKVHSHEWRRKLKAKNVGSIFKLKYFGKLHDTYNNLIVGTDFAPSKIYAVDILTNEEILLFDGCKHGYNAMFCDEFTHEQLNNRNADKLYISENESDEFEIIISTYYGIDYEDEFREEADSNGNIELIKKKLILKM